jgi:hypothetical protein
MDVEYLKLQTLSNLRELRVFPAAGLVKAVSLVKLTPFAQQATNAHVFSGD